MSVLGPDLTVSEWLVVDNQKPRYDTIHEHDISLLSLKNMINRWVDSSYYINFHCKRLSLNNSYMLEAYIKKNKNFRNIMNSKRSSSFFDVNS